MPGAGGLRTPGGDRALRELRPAPRHVVLRVLDRLDEAAPAIDPDASYPDAWLLTTASGYALARETADRSPGEAVRRDAVALADALCRVIGLERADLPEGSVDADTLADRWGVSKRTLLRYRDRGLVARRVVEGPRGTLRFTPRAIAAFERANHAALRRAGGFSRMDAAQRDALLERARELERTGVRGAAAIARRLAADAGRSPEAVRTLLLARGFAPGTPAGPWSERERRVALRAHDRAIEPAAITRRLGRPTASVRRMIDVGRTRRLCAVLPAGAALWEAQLAGRFVPLGAPGPTTLADLIEEMRTASPPDRLTEGHAMADARALVGRAAGLLAGATPPPAEALDRAETDLLTASRLRAVAVRPVLAVVLRVLEGRLGGPVESRPAREAAELIERALAASFAAAARFDPARGGRLSAAVSIAADHAIPHDAQRKQAGADRARRSFAGVPVRDWTRRLDPWQAWLEPTRAVRWGLPALDAADRALLEARFGYGERPHTLAALGERFGIARPWVARELRAALRRARRAGVGTL